MDVTFLDRIFVEPPGSYRHRECCYLCNAISVVEENADSDQTPLLYTNWGRDAEYRSEPLGPAWHAPIS